MGKKKREHVVFDQMLKPKKSIPFSMINKQDAKKEKKRKRKGGYKRFTLVDEMKR